MSMLPSGTVTFLFTDIEGSTQLWEKYSAEMRTALAQHDAILRDAIEANHGHLIKTTGDGVHAVFEKAIDAIHATLAIQRFLATCHFFENPDVTLRVRMGLHTGEAELRADDYYGQSLNRAARIMSVAFGGQILLSSITAEVIREHLPAGVDLQDLGEHHLKDLIRPEHLYQLTAPGLRQDFPAIKSSTTLQGNLPTQLTSFIGREKELIELKALLESARLVTLTGSGGTGKTRLSIEVGAQLLPNFAHGVWLIELAPLSDSAQLMPALAQVFGLHELPTSPLVNIVTDYLRDKRLLLILDNCEHLISACARLADDLLHQCTGLKILASSREALGIAGEMAYRTPSLADSESTRLFVERAQAANPKFSLTESHAASVAQICHRLDGIPLAIELAAARTKFLSVDQVAARLDDLFRLLVGGSRTALPRQQTLRALIDWSYDLLSEEEKQLLRTASVFMGGWTLDALDAVSEDSNAIEHLEGLINKSLVVAEEHDREMRYFLLETIRQYAREKLFEAKQSFAARDRHFVYFVELSEKLWESFHSERLLPMVNRTKDEIENLRAALEWGSENHVEENLRLAANFCVVSSLIGILGEGFEWAGRAIEDAKNLPMVEGDADIHRKKLIAKALYAQGMVGTGIGKMPLVIEVLKEAIAISRMTGDKRILGYSLEMYYTATAFLYMPDREEAAQEGFHIFSQEIEDGFGIGMGYMNMARLAEARGNESEKEMYFEKIRERIREAPGSYQVAMFHLGMGMDESVRGNYATAKRIFEDGRRIFKHIGSINFQLVMQSEIGHIERYTGNLRQAKTIYQETIKGWQTLGNRPAIAHQLECFGFLAVSDEEPQRALKLLSAAETLRERIQSQRVSHEQVEYEQSLAQLRSMLLEADFNALWADGRELTMEQSIALALNEL